MKDRLDHPTEQEVRNTINRCINYRSRCATAEGGKVPDYAKYLLYGDAVNQAGSTGGGGVAGGANPSWTVSSRRLFSATLLT